MAKPERSSQDGSGIKLKDSCEATDKHTFVWVAADNGQQLWKCSQCLKTKIEYDDSQP